MRFIKYTNSQTNDTIYDQGFLCMNNFAVQLDVTVSVDTPTWGYLFTMGRADAGTWGYGININADRTLVFRYGNGTFTAPAISTGKKYNLILSVDSEYNAYCYIDYKLVGSFKPTVAPFSDYSTTNEGHTDGSETICSIGEFGGLGVGCFRYLNSNTISDVYPIDTTQVTIDYVKLCDEFLSPYQIKFIEAKPQIFGSFDLVNIGMFTTNNGIGSGGVACYGTENGYKDYYTSSDRADETDTKYTWNSSIDDYDTYTIEQKYSDSRYTPEADSWYTETLIEIVSNGVSVASYFYNNDTGRQCDKVIIYRDGELYYTGDSADGGAPITGDGKIHTYIIQRHFNSATPALKKTWIPLRVYGTGAAVQYYRKMEQGKISTPLCSSHSNCYSYTEKIFYNNLNGYRGLFSYPYVGAFNNSSKYGGINTFRIATGYENEYPIENYLSMEYVNWDYTCPIQTAGIVLGASTTSSYYRNGETKTYDAFVTGESIDLDISSGKTLSIWAKSTNKNTDENVLVGSYYDRNCLFDITNNNTDSPDTGMFYFRLTKSDGTNVFVPFKYGTVGDGNWHNYTVTYDASSIKTYTDGQLSKTLSVDLSGGIKGPGTYINTNNNYTYNYGNTFIFGGYCNRAVYRESDNCPIYRDYSRNSGCFTGSVAGFKMFYSALTADQIHMFITENGVGGAVHYDGYRFYSEHDSNEFGDTVEISPKTNGINVARKLGKSYNFFRTTDPIVGSNFQSVPIINDSIAILKNSFSSCDLLYNNAYYSSCYDRRHATKITRHNAPNLYNFSTYKDSILSSIKTMGNNGEYAFKN